MSHAAWNCTTIWPISPCEAFNSATALFAYSASLDTVAVRHTRAVLAYECTHVCGNYWDLWPTVFRANMVLAERGEARVVWGVAPRAEPTRTQWSSVPPAKVRLGWLVGFGRPEPPAGTAAVPRHLYMAPEPTLALTPGSGP